MFSKEDRVIFDPGVKDVLEYAPLVKPGVFTVIDSNDRFSYIEDKNKECTSVPNEILLKVPLYKAGEEIIVDTPPEGINDPFWITQEMYNMNGKKYAVLAVFHNYYYPSKLGEDGCRYILNEPRKFNWASTYFKKTSTDEEIDDLNNDLDNLLKENSNENRLQEKRDSESNGVSNYEGGIPSRAYKTRIAVCNLVHQTGIRGQKSKA